MKSIKSRLIVSILAITIIPIIAFLVYSLVFVSDDQIQTNLNDNKTKMTWANQHLQSKVDQLEDVVYSMHINSDLLTFVDQSYTSSREIEEVLRNALYTNANLASKISVVSNASDLMVSFDYENGFKANSAIIYNPYQDLQGQPRGVYFSAHQDRILVVHTMNDFMTKEELGIIVIELNNSLVEEFEDIFGEDTNFMLFSDQAPIYQSNEQINFEEILRNQKADQNAFSFQIDQAYVWVSELPKNDVYIASLVPTNTIEAFNNQVISTGLLIIFISLAVTIPTSILLSNRITKPIIQLVDHMSEFEFGYVKGDKQNYDEIVLLEKSYNNMIDQMSKMIKERYQNKIDVQSAQLKALQAQINPHFLANTFQLIGGMAMNVDAEDIYDATIKMSNMVRYSMKINEDSTKLREELQHIENYLHIQKLRFTDQLEFTIAIPEEILDIAIPKLTLQPILENAFKHGLKNTSGKWSIHIASQVGEDLRVTITDNGSGIEEEQLTKLNQQFVDRDNHLTIADNDFSGIGLVNIDSRIKLLYGGQYGLVLEKNPKGGTKVIIHLPKEAMSCEY